MPPVHHLDSVVRNAELFEAKWGYRTMGHWLYAFRVMGLIDDTPDRPITILRRPDAADLALTGQQSDQPYTNSASVIRAIEARGGRPDGMRIALLAHLRHPIAPPFAGGLESYTWHLAEGLSARGHDVVLFASGDSDPRFARDPVIPVHQEARFPGLEHRGDAGLRAHLDGGYAAACDRIAAGGFDVLHNNSLSRLPLEPQRLAATPTVTSLHVPPYDALRWFVHASAVPGHHLTATSERCCGIGGRKARRRGPRCSTTASIRPPGPSSRKATAAPSGARASRR